MSDLLDKEACNVGITIADGSEVTGTFKGKVKISLNTNKGKSCNLTLTNVIFVEGLNRRLFSVMAFCKNKNYSINFNHKGGFLDFGDGHEIATSYDAFRSPETDNISQVQDDLQKEHASPTKSVGFDVSVREISPSKDDKLKNNEQLVDESTKGGGNKTSFNNTPSRTESRTSKSKTSDERSRRMATSSSFCTVQRFNNWLTT
jgi:hypothetical protein